MGYMIEQQLVDARNAATSRAEVVRAHEDLSFCGCYIDGIGRVTTWPGDVVGNVMSYGTWHRHPNSMFGTKWRQVAVRDLQGRKYTGRQYTSQDLVRLRRVK